MPKTQKNTTKETVKEVMPAVPADDKSLAFQVMDAADEDQIAAEAEGRFSEVAEQMVYEFVQDGKSVTGLSWVGTKETAIALARKKICSIVIEKVNYQPDPTDNEYFLYDSHAKDLVSGRTAIGFKRQWKKLRKRSGEIIDNPFWFEHGASKAKRNAMQELMPVSFIKKMITSYLKEGKKVILSAPKQVDQVSESEQQRIVGHLGGIERITTKAELNKFESELIKSNETLTGTNKLTGKEMYLIRQAIARKRSRVK